MFFCTDVENKYCLLMRNKLHYKIILTFCAGVHSFFDGFFLNFSVIVFKFTKPNYQKKCLGPTFMQVKNCL
jgi:hypothetical protein